MTTQRSTNGFAGTTTTMTSSPLDDRASQRRRRLGGFGRRLSVPASLLWRESLSRPRTIDALRTTVVPSLPDALSIYRSRSAMSLLTYPRVVSPHANPAGARGGGRRGGQISSLDVDDGPDGDGRFLLCAGGSDCTVSVFDLSRLGSDYHLEGHGDIDVDGGAGGRTKSKLTEHERRRKLGTHRPIAHSRRAPPPPPASSEDVVDDPTYLPPGHRHAVVRAQWYPADTGAFVSASSRGSILVWDTNAFCPAFHFCIAPSVSTLRCMDMPRSSNAGHALLALGSDGGNEGGPDLCLCDVSSGACTHRLIGHGRGGVNAASWCPTDGFILATAGDDRTVRLWDVRKSGGAACLAVLDREATEESDAAPGGSRRGGSNAFARLPPAKRSRLVGPSNYSRAESSSVESHGGPVTAVAWSPDGNFLVSAGLDGRLRLWDVKPDVIDRSGDGGGFGGGGRQSGLRPKRPSSFTSSGRLLPVHFLGPSSPNAVPRRRLRSRINDGESCICLAITQPGSQRTATVWVGGGGGGELCGYDLHGIGGRPDKVLSGHLGAVTSVVSQDKEMQLFTGGMDGMVLGWGCPPVLGDEDEGGEPYFSHASRSQWQNRQHGILWNGRNGAGAGDVDCW